MSEKYNSDEISVEKITLKKNGQTLITDDLSFSILIKKLNEKKLNDLYCRIEFVLDIAYRNLTFDIFKSESKDYDNSLENINLDFLSIESLSELLKKQNIEDSFWCNISCINIYINYRLSKEETEPEKSIKITIPLNIYKDTMTDNITYKTTYNPFDYL
ncbi:hypothetical protein DICPUDRAFT_76549 [Dictyostelium purpureum]|uniref:Uncharacterized protein n=1 Tax=Dictyostelium purpureum TaxID=5786 RepID=F0ZDY3_DICPU|nr:uncharacterized protein DICPUDRAFT_76549 [Dictyostelium purpureum]EGC37864.1 hypothetical protein DICPUDRAFT_76549 [Dictyostelium purpureum]|eukprot:XP_003285614.1 hypothetical protein DICPUDRAFT_76549 [Dictyostelium purpureum]